MTIQKYLKNRFGQIENKRKPLTIHFRKKHDSRGNKISKSTK
jgi:hypothetical protein